MKKILIIMLTIFYNEITFSQEIECNVFNYKKISLVEDPSTVNLRIQKILSCIKEVKYELIVMDSLSEFKAVKKVYSDDFYDGAINYGGGAQTIYVKNNTTFDVLTLKKIDKDYFIKDSINKIKWTITNETKKINDFDCFKANGVYNRTSQKLSTETQKLENKYIETKVVAWFCPQFPYNFGPGLFFGLPGLIFEAYIENSNVAFVLESIEKRKEKEIKINTLPILTEEEELKQLNKMIENSK